jgi:RimJ/RimL family protein N-acetyltransferase
MPRLDTPPVLLRAFEPGDVPLIMSVAGDPLIPLITTVPTSGSEDDARAYLQRQHDRLTTRVGYSFAIADAQTGRAVGQIGLWTSQIGAGHASIGYWVAGPHRRRGYARAALAALTAWACGIEDIKRLHLFVEPWNQGSWKTAEACGYHREGLLRRWERVGDEHRDMYVYSVIPEHS